MSILVVGSLNIDFVTYTKKAPSPGETVLGNAFTTNPGGKGANQAVACKRANSEVYMLGCVGTDSFGTYLKDIIREEKINDLIKIKDTTTGNASIIIEESSQNRIIVVPGANYMVTCDDVEQILEQIKAIDIVILQLEIPIDVIVYTIKLCKKLGKMVILNPAPVVKLDDDIYQYIDYITPNETELTHLTSCQEVKEGAQALLAKGVKNVIVTLGDKGVYLKNNQTEAFIEANKVKACDTTAAGDCFNGYFAAGIDQGMSIIDAIKYGNKAASISVTRLGAIPSIPKFNEL